MSYVEQVARDALQAAHADLGKARRGLLLVAGVLALVHLLTVYPYLVTSREIAAIEATMAADATLLTRLEPEIESLRLAGESTGTQLTRLLNGVTEEMMARFADMRTLVGQAMAEPVDEPAQHPLEQPEQPLPGTDFAPQMPPMQQMQMPPMQMPPMQQMQMPQSNLPPSPGYDPGGIYVAPELAPILADLAAGEPAWERLIAYARTYIVEEAYARAQRAWHERIRPDYLKALDAAAQGAREVAGQAPDSAAQTAAALRDAAARMIEQKAALEAIVLRHDQVVDEALGTDWWQTVPGKGAYADAVGQSVAEQMHAVLETAQTPSAAIEEALALQEELRATLVRRQEELAAQFAEQRQQLASLSGTAGVVPVDLASFIGLFPLVLGLTLGFMLWRAGQARRQGALAAADLARAAPEDRETRDWLARRVLGGDDALMPLLATCLLAVGALAWIALAAWQVATSPGDPPLAPWRSAALASLLVLGAAAWDGTAIGRLGAQLRRPAA